jgi:ubiquinone/menaquinone biosynthesis C-methylase UbiE
MLIDTMTPEMEALKVRLKATWMAGDYAHFATYLEPGALEFLASLRVRPGERLLDIACGAGQIVIPAARQGIPATGIDIAANSIAQAKARAAAEGLDARFDEGDAEMLPYEDGSFDLVISLIGSMFAPQPERVAAEMLRVCRPGGRIVMANWTPEGFVGQMFKIIGSYAPPSPLMPSPLKWGDESVVRQRLGLGVSCLRLTKHAYPITYPFPPREIAAFYRDYYGPINRAYAGLDAAGQQGLMRDLEQLWSAHNLSANGSGRFEYEYLKVEAVRA